MGWSGGNYTKGNNATGGWTGDASLGIGIEAGRHDTQDNDFATGIDQCLNKDGSNAATGNLNLGGFIPTNLAAGTAAAPALCAGGDVNTGIFSAAADQIGVATNGTERVRIDASGKVGIGTTTPSVNLDVQGTAGQENLSRFSADGAGPVLALRKSRNASVGSNTIVQNGDQLGVIVFQGANGTAYNDGAAIVSFVDGTPGASNDMPGGLLFYTTPDGSGSLTARMQITSGGVILVNRSTAVNGAVICAGSSSGSQMIVVDGGNSGTGAGGGIAIQNGGSTICAMGGFSSAYSGGAYDGTPTMYFSMTPKVLGIGTGPGTWPMKYNTTNNNWTYDTSKRSAKDNIRDSKYGLESVLQLKPRQFNYLESEQFREDVGFIADEVYEVIPELTPLDAEGEPAGVSYDRLTSVLCKAIQELNAKVEALETRVAELET